MCRMRGSGWFEEIARAGLGIRGGLATKGQAGGRDLKPIDGCSIGLDWRIRRGDSGGNGTFV